MNKLLEQTWFLPYEATARRLVSHNIYGAPFHRTPPDPLNLGLYVTGSAAVTPENFLLTDQRKRGAFPNETIQLVRIHPSLIRDAALCNTSAAVQVEFWPPVVEHVREALAFMRRSAYAWPCRRQ